jgi:hypothetical protein
LTSALDEGEQEEYFFLPNKLLSHESPKNYKQMQMEMDESVLSLAYFFQNTRDIPSYRKFVSAIRHPIYALKKIYLLFPRINLYVA